MLSQSNTGFVRVVRVLDGDELAVSDPAGLAYSPTTNSFQVVAGAGAEQPTAATLDLVQLSAFGERVGFVQIAAPVSDPVNLAFDGRLNRLLLLTSSANQLIELRAGANGALEAATLRSHAAGHFGLQNAQGMSIDPATGRLFILDAIGPRLVTVEPAADGSFDGAVITALALQPTGLLDLRGLAFDPTTGHLHLFSPGAQTLYEITQDGQLVATRDVAELKLKNLQGMVFAPSGDLTDAPSALNLYLIDSALAGVWGSQPTPLSPEIAVQAYLPLVVDRSADERAALSAQGLAASDALAAAPGRIVELTFTAFVAPAASSFQPPLVQIIDTAAFSPPSPDPSALVYLPDRGTLLIADGEVDEMPPFFTGDNLFEMSLAGVLSDTMTTIHFSDEPTGIDLNPANRHLFMSDDTGPRTIYELNPGGDGLYTTADDSVTSFTTAEFDSRDPEGVAYARDGSGALFIADGVNREVYRITSGANGRFDGVSPLGDDEVTHFDTLHLGLDDPEDIAFNPYNGHLYLVGLPMDKVLEFTTEGVLVQTIDTAHANMRKPGGLAFAPGSQQPDEWSLYIAARGVDNDVDPNENDGKVYEFTLGQPVDATATATSTTTPPTPTEPLTPGGPTATGTLTPGGPTATGTLTPGGPTATGTLTTTPIPTNTVDSPTDTPTLVNTGHPPSATLTLTPGTPTVTPTLADAVAGAPLFLPLLLSGGKSEEVLASADITLAFAAEADARVQQSNPDTNYGTSSKLSADSPGEESYLRFTVAGVTGAVQSATLRLLATDSSSNGPAVHGTSNNWSEMGVTWNNRPSPTSGAMDNKDAIALNTWVEFNVTALVMGNGTYNFALLPDSTQGISLRSRETTNPPQLVVTFTSGPTPIPTNTPTNTPTDTPLPPTNTPTFTNTPSNTPVPPTNTATNTPGPPTNTPTFTNTPSNTPVPPTNTPTNTPGPPTNTPTFTNTPSNTPVPPTNTATNTPSNTPVPPTNTATNTPTITPTPINTSATTVLTLAPVADARVYQASPSSNYGTSSKLDVDSPDYHSYIRFAVSGVTGAVLNAKLRLMVTNGTNDGPGVYAATDNNWSETTITWNNRPAASLDPLDNLGTAPAGAWVEYNVTALVTGNDSFSFVLQPDSTDGIAFSSREGSSPPQLVLTVVNGPTPTPGPSPTPTNTPTPGPTATPSNTPDGSSAVFVGAGDIADCSRTQDEATAKLLDNIPGTVYTVGDNAYTSGTAAQFTNCYQPTWGRHKARTHPAVGDNDYNTSGATGYYTYFGAAAGDPSKGYYSYDVGAWRIYALNSNCSEAGGCRTDDPQWQWLQADLAANPRTCSLAILHEPIFVSGSGDSSTRDLVALLYGAGADIILSGHRHFYERFALQNPSGGADPTHGIRQFVVGTGGASLSSFGSVAPNSQIRNNQTYGVLKFTLHPTSYDWQFIPISGQTFTDAGSAPCVTP